MNIWKFIALILVLVVIVDMADARRGKKKSKRKFKGLLPEFKPRRRETNSLIESPPLSDPLIPVNRNTQKVEPIVKPVMKVETQPLLPPSVEPMIPIPSTFQNKPTSVPFPTNQNKPIQSSSLPSNRNPPSNSLPFLPPVSNEPILESPASHVPSNVYTPPEKPANKPSRRLPKESMPSVRHKPESTTNASWMNNKMPFPFTHEIPKKPAVKKESRKPEAKSPYSEYISTQKKTVPSTFTSKRKTVDIPKGRKFQNSFPYNKEKPTPVVRSSFTSNTPTSGTKTSTIKKQIPTSFPYRELPSEGINEKFRTFLMSARSPFSSHGRPSEPQAAKTRDRVRNFKKPETASHVGSKSFPITPTRPELTFNQPQTESTPKPTPNPSTEHVPTFQAFLQNRNPPPQIPVEIAFRRRSPVPQNSPALHNVYRMIASWLVSHALDGNSPYPLQPHIMPSSRRPNTVDINIRREPQQQPKPRRNSRKPSQSVTIRTAKVEKPVPKSRPMTRAERIIAEHADMRKRIGEKAFAEYMDEMYDIDVPEKPKPKKQKRKSVRRHSLSFRW